jgi:hypothetical protein
MKFEADPTDKLSLHSNGPEPEFDATSSSMEKPAFHFLPFMRHNSDVESECFFMHISGNVQGFVQGDYQHVEMTFGSDPKEK